MLAVDNEDNNSGGNPCCGCEVCDWDCCCCGWWIDLEPKEIAAQIRAWKKQARRTHRQPL